jgi:LacI family transcriptional regulator
VEHEVGYALARRCLEESPKVTAIVAINDMVAYGVRAALIDAGIRIPEDMSLCGFDNIYPSRFSGVDLTTIEHAIVERGRSSIRLLSEKFRVESESNDENVITRVEYQSRLVIGRTTGKVKEED